MFECLTDHVMYGVLTYKEAESVYTSVIVHIIAPEVCVMDVGQPDQQPVYVRVCVWCVCE